MRIAVASHDLYPDPGSGGTGRYVHETTRRLADRGHDVTVVTRRRGDVPRRELVAGVRVRRYDVTVADRSAPAVLSDLPGADRAVSRYLAAADPDLLSFQGPVTALLADRAVDVAVPRSCTLHSPWPAEYRIRTRGADLAAWRRRLNVAIRQRLEARLLARADEVVTLSEFVRRRVRERYDPPAPTAVVPGGVDADRYAPAAGKHPTLDTDGPAFITVRRLSPRMGHERLLEGFADVRERHPDARLFVAGDGPLRESLEARARALGVGGATTFLGYVPDGELPAAYATADVFVLPTAALEGFGLATLEALAAGTPVVGTPVGATAGLLRGFEGADAVPAPMLASAATSDALARGMDAWAALDPAERAAAGRACRRRAREHYTWEATVAGLEVGYRALVDGTAPAR